MRTITNEEFLHRVKALIKDEYVFLEKYVHTHHPILVKHNECGEIYKVSPANFLRGRRCPYCYLANKKKNETVFEKEFYNVSQGEYELLSEYRGMQRPIKVRHKKCGFLYSVRATSFLNDGRRCPNCNTRKKRNTSDFISKVEELCPNEYLVLGEYITEKHKIKMFHKKCTKTFYIRPNNFIWGKQRCTHCKTKSEGEKRIKHFLDSNKIMYHEQKKLNDCVYKKKLSFDFFLPEYNLCIEFDGIQHYRLGFNKTVAEFKNQQKRDEIKNQYCKTNGINLLRIPYWEIDNLDEVLSNKVNEMQAAQKGLTKIKEKNDGKEND